MQDVGQAQMLEMQHAGTEWVLHVRNLTDCGREVAKQPYMLHATKCFMPHTWVTVAGKCIKKKMTLMTT